MNTAVAIKHVAFEHLGSFESVLLEQGYAVEYLDACTDDLSDPTLAAGPELLVVLGAPVGVYEHGG